MMKMNHENDYQQEFNLVSSSVLNKMITLIRELNLQIEIHQIQIKQLIILMLLKSEDSFDYSQDIEEEMPRNNHNLTSLFELKFQQEIQTQNNLIINCPTDIKFKTTLLQLIKSPEMLAEIKRDIENNPFITRFIHIFQEDQKKYPSVDKQMVQIYKKLQKKASNDNEPLTFYVKEVFIQNQYVDLSDKIQSCFLLRKGIKEETVNQDRKQDVKCGLKMKKYKKHYNFYHYCAFCVCGFKNQSGLRSHQNTCKSRQNAKEVKQKKRQTSKRISKKRHQNLDEQRMLKLK